MAETCTRFDTPAARLASATLRAPMAWTARKRWAPRSDENAGKIDNGVGAVHGALDGPAHPYIRGDRGDLADGAERLQEIRELRPAHRDPDPVAALDQRAHDMAADETGAAEDGDDARIHIFGVHGSSIAGALRLPIAARRLDV